MPQIPISLLNSLMKLKGFDKDSFERVHASGEQVTSIRINPLKTTITNNKRRIKDIELPGSDPIQGSTRTSTVPWSSQGYYLDVRPSFTFDPLFHAGTY